jgi:hypothetical protein
MAFWWMVQRRIVDETDFDATMSPRPIFNHQGSENTRLTLRHERFDRLLAAALHTAVKSLVHARPNRRLFHSAATRSWW